MLFDLWPKLPWVVFTVHLFLTSFFVTVGRHCALFTFTFTPDLDLDSDSDSDSDPDPDPDPDLDPDPTFIPFVIDILLNRAFFAARFPSSP